MGESQQKKLLDSNDGKQKPNPDPDVPNWVGFLIERYSEGTILCIDTLDRILHFCFWDEDVVVHLRLQRQDILSHLIDHTVVKDDEDGDKSKVSGIADKIMSELTTQEIQRLPEFIEAREALLNQGFFKFQNGSTVEWNPSEADFYKSQYLDEFSDKFSILTPYVESPEHLRVSDNEKH